MTVDPFWFGVFSTLAVEAMLLVIAAAISVGRRRR
jgi:hypothetical protein